jgi:hypothetical protein
VSDPRPTGREFPYLGATSQAATPATCSRLFVTTPMLRVVPAQDGSSQIEGGPFHAKQMGTLLTACGQVADSWTKAWDVPFAVTLTPVCLECAAVARYVARNDDPPASSEVAPRTPHGSARR